MGCEGSSECYYLLTFDRRESPKAFAPPTFMEGLKMPVRDSQVRRFAVSEICYVSRQVFAFQVWSSDAYPNLDYGAFPEMNTNYYVLRNASIDSSLLAYRKLDEFFTPVSKKKYPDDLHISDFPHYNGVPLLTKEDRKTLHKLIAHTTSHGIETSVDWYFDTICLKTAALCMDFFDYLLKTYRLRAKNERLDIEETKGFMLGYLDWMAMFQRNRDVEIWRQYQIIRQVPFTRRPHWRRLFEVMHASKNE